MIFGGEGSLSFASDNTYIRTSFHELALYFLNDDSQYWMVTTSFVLLSLFPLSLILTLGMVLMGSKYNFKYFILAFAGAWVVGIGLLIVSGTQIQREFWSEGRSQSKISVSPEAMDTVQVSVAELEDWFNIDNDHFFSIDEEKANVGAVRFDIEESPNDSIYIQSIRYARGASVNEAKTRASQIDYNLGMQDDQLILDPYFTVYHNDKWREQELYVMLLLPEGKSAYLGNGTEKVIWDIKNTSNTFDGNMSGKTWTMTPEGLTYVDCWN